MTSQAGTLGYMAPEMLVRKPVYTANVDVWALGMIFWQLFADRPNPFWKTLEEVEDQAREMEGKPLEEALAVLAQEGVDPLLIDLVSKVSLENV